MCSLKRRLPCGLRTISSPSSRRCKRSLASLFRRQSGADSICTWTKRGSCRQPGRSCANTSNSIPNSTLSHLKKLRRKRRNECVYKNPEKMDGKEGFCEEARQSAGEHAQLPVISSLSRH